MCWPDRPLRGSKMAEPSWLVSVHDLMPGTIAAVKNVVQRLDTHEVTPLTLLVVPGVPWSDADIEWLRERQDRGDRLAGHGWSHRAQAPRGIYDRLHRRFFSRGVAEHLPLSAGDIARLIERCHEWFVSRDLVAPDLYVPPAWAMGRISRRRLRDLPFRRYETLSGVYDATDDRFERVPLIGFEADTPFRALSLRLSNGLNRAAAGWHGRLRVAIHPHDLELRLRDDLARLVAHPAACVPYS